MFKASLCSNSSRLSFLDPPSPPPIRPTPNKNSAQQLQQLAPAPGGGGAAAALAYQLGGLGLGAAPPATAQLQQQPQELYAPASPAGAAAAAQPPRVRPLPPVVAVGAESRTVKIRGLPFRATPLEILTVFDGYDYLVDSLQLGIDALGRPSGEAWLSFATPAEALRAVRERNRQYLGARYLELSLT